MNQGMLLEAFNLASTWRLPVLFVCKDDQWAITSESRKHTGGSLREHVLGLSGVPLGWRAPRFAVCHGSDVALVSSMPADPERCIIRGKASAGVRREMRSRL
jgi:TPP-dependent pyruvate/acetoin dehydrogenase alpha subunit